MILVDANILIYSHVESCAHGETNFNGNVMQTTRLIGPHFRVERKPSHALKGQPKELNGGT